MVENNLCFPLLGSLLRSHLFHCWVQRANFNYTLCATRLSFVLEVEIHTSPLRFSYLPPLKLSDQESPFNITKLNMSAGLPSDEVAEDYKNSLEDLTMNSKYEISNLTVIAKENTEHGMAISRVLEKHIRDVSAENFM